MERQRTEVKGARKTVEEQKSKAGRPKGHPWNPVRSPAAQAGRAESGAAALSFQDSPVADLQRGSEIGLQTAVGRKQEMSAALPSGTLPVSK